MIAKLLEKTGRSPRPPTGPTYVLMSLDITSTGGVPRHRSPLDKESPGAFKPLKVLKDIDQVIVMGAVADEISDAAKKFEDGSNVFAKAVNWNIGPYLQASRQPSRRPFVRPDGGER